MATRNFSYQVRSQPDGRDCCVVLDNDANRIIAQATRPEDMDGFEQNLKNAGLALDQVVWLTSMARNHFRQIPRTGT